MSFRHFRHSAICISHFELPSNSRPPHGPGSASPCNRPRSLARNGPRFSRRYGRRYGPRNGPRYGTSISPRNGIGHGRRSSTRPGPCFSSRNGRKPSSRYYSRYFLSSCSPNGLRISPSYGPNSRLRHSRSNSARNSHGTGYCHKAQVCRCARLTPARFTV
jgi:hypothetical protein